MHILLTDVLTCPRCGPDFGLIILADRMEDRRILEGSVGCANCRESYPVVGGVGDLRFPPGEPPRSAASRGPGTERAFRLAALMGVTEGPGNVLVVGPGAGLAPEIAAAIPEIEVIAAHDVVAAENESPRVSRILFSDRLPLRNASIRGVAVTGEPFPRLLREAIRTLGRSGRIVIETEDDATAEIVANAGLEILLQQEGVLVASYQAHG